MKKAACLPEKVVIIDALSSKAHNTSAMHKDWMKWDDLIHEGRNCKLGQDEHGNISWKRMGFDWPLWILFSSGTTGQYLDRYEAFRDRPSF